MTTQISAYAYFADCPYLLRNYNDLINKLETNALDDDAVNKAFVFRAIIVTLLQVNCPYEANKLYNFGEITGSWNPSAAKTARHAEKILQLKNFAIGDLARFTPAT